MKEFVGRRCRKNQRMPNPAMDRFFSPRIPAATSVPRRRDSGSGTGDPGEKTGRSGSMFMAWGITRRDRRYPIPWTWVSRLAPAPRMSKHASSSRP
jgi:hypothetical protein